MFREAQMVGGLIDSFWVRVEHSGGPKPPQRHMCQPHMHTCIDQIAYIPMLNLPLNLLLNNRIWNHVGVGHRSAWFHAVCLSGFNVKYCVLVLSVWGAKPGGATSKTRTSGHFFRISSPWSITPSPSVDIYDVSNLDSLWKQMPRGITLGEWMRKTHLMQPDRSQLYKLKTVNDQELRRGVSLTQEGMEWNCLKDLLHYNHWNPL